MSAPIESPYVESPSAESVDVAIVGGGISGLATAHRLRELAPQLSVVVLESRNRLGGVLETVREAGFLLEGGPDNFITNVPWAVDLCRRIGFAEQLITTNPDQRNAFVVRRGKLEKIPPGFVVMAPSRLWPLVSTPILSPWGKLRMAGEYIVPARRDAGDESLAAFVRRRFGREVYDRLVQPLVGGIYTGDPEQLSLQATLPRFQEMERKHGGLIRGMRKSSHGGNPTNYQRNDTTPPNKTQDSGGRYSLFVAPRDGATSLVDAIAGRLEPHTIRLNSPVANVSHLPSGGWAIDLADKDTRQIRSQHLVLATPARLTASLLKPTLPRLANDLEKIQYSGCTLVSLGYRRQDISHPLDGFGFVVPFIERRQILSASFSSVKYAGRAPDACVLLRAYVGGALQPELAELPDDQIIELTRRELSALLGISGSPVITHIHRRPQSMPQYYVGHNNLVDSIFQQTNSLQGLHLVGNSFRGVGIPYCVRDGEATAQQIVDTTTIRTQ